MVQYPRPYGFTRVYASRSEDLTITSLTVYAHLVQFHQSSSCFLGTVLVSQIYLLSVLSSLSVWTQSLFT